MPQRVSCVMHNSEFRCAGIACALGGTRAPGPALVQELLEIFHVVKMGVRPPIGGKAPGTKGGWTIGASIFLVPGLCVLLHRLHPSPLGSILVIAFVAFVSANLSPEVGAVTSSISRVLRYPSHKRAKRSEIYGGVL